MLEAMGKQSQRKFVVSSSNMSKKRIRTNEFSIWVKVRERTKKHWGIFKTEIKVDLMS